MPKKFRNNVENFQNSIIDSSSGPRSEHVGPSLITTSPEQALHAEIEAVVSQIAGKEPKMLERIKHDLHAAQHALPEQALQARDRLAKVGILKNWPVELLGVLESRLQEARLDFGVQKGLGSLENNSKGRQAFEGLFGKGKGKNIQ